jgi:hypothetical protein
LNIAVGLALLQQIGFTETAARKALIKAGGDVSRAFQILVEEAQTLLNIHKANIAQQNSQK